MIIKILTFLFLLIMKILKILLKKNQDWKTIHPDFAEINWWNKKTYQQLWEENNLTYQDAQDFLAIGFKLNDYDEVVGWKKTKFTPSETKELFSAGFDKYDYQKAKQWKDNSFTSAQAKKWISAGFQLNEAKFAAHLRASNHTPQTAFQIRIQTKHWLDCYYPQDGTCIRERENYSRIYNLGKTRSEITYLNLSEQKLIGALDFSDFINLKELVCSNNKLTKLILQQSNQLEYINVTDNYLTTFNYSCLNPVTLRKLNLKNNNLEPTNISVLSQLVELTNLDISNSDYWIKAGNSGNRFHGSFKSLESFSKLEDLNVKNSNLSTDLEYLPLSLNGIGCNGKIRNKLSSYNNSLSNWQKAHPYLIIKVRKELMDIDFSQGQLTRVTTIPQFLQNELIINSFIPDYHPELNYSNFLLRDPRPFSWENSSFESNKSNISSTLPLRLYNIANNKVEIIENNSNISDYLILSYCWGNEWEKTPKNYGQSYHTDLTKFGRKALNKVIATHNFLKKDSEFNINHIWIDNFCINQTDNIEKNHEVAKQKQYYNNAAVTLIAIDAELGEFDVVNETNIIKESLAKIIQSPWFKRSWTFQEGLLSKQTIFMLDDYLIDGRLLVFAWSKWQNFLLEKDFLLSKNDFYHPEIFITPLGWSYGVQPHHSINLTLDEALAAVSYRSQTVPIDGIYSILGLLPYGDKIEAKYQSIYHEYTQSELNEALTELVKEAIKNDHGKGMFVWLDGCGSNSWPIIPRINLNGSTSAKNLLSDKHGRSTREVTEKINKLTLQGLQISAGFILINNDEKIIVEIEDKKNSDVVLHFTISKRQQLVSINWAMKKHLKDDISRDLFIDMINKAVVLKLEDSEIFNRLINQIEDELFTYELNDNLYLWKEGNQIEMIRKGEESKIINSSVIELDNFKPMGNNSNLLKNLEGESIEVEENKSDNKEEIKEINKDISFDEWQINFLKEHGISKDNISDISEIDDEEVFEELIEEEDFY